ncbi:MAG TPA: protein-L-isoaspartate(D-aspartate) O-methyltransferase [Candidatus Sulfotelmatobacter sp.]|nr:protein-L-isoaspartate(D-aspartate) O-methyltransferase [Candidatus Sulfotelmatobacter sp.]
MSDQARQIRLLMELRRQGITDTGVLAAIERVPREAFVPDTFKDQAYENIALPIKQGQTISQPYVVAFMTEALRVGSRMKVLEIGTGSGYQSAVLARLCRRVYTIERYRSLLQEAEARFQALRLTNITTRVADGMKGWPEQAPFERIVVTAAAGTVPAALVDQLAVDGIMVLPLGSTTTEQEIVRVVRTPQGSTEEALLAVRFVPLLPGVAEEG